MFLIISLSLIADSFSSSLSLKSRRLHLKSTRSYLTKHLSGQSAYHVYYSVSLAPASSRLSSEWWTAALSPVWWSWSAPPKCAAWFTRAWNHAHFVALQCQSLIFRFPAWHARPRSAGSWWSDDLCQLGHFSCQFCWRSHLISIIQRVKRKKDTFLM